MNAVIGIDGSPCSKVVLEVAAAIRWPSPTTLRVVSVLDTLQLLGRWGGFPPNDPTDIEEAVLADLAVVAAKAAAELEQTGAQVEHRTVMGRPADAILAQAVESQADLILVGHRGRGALQSTLLGSVSAEVVDRSPCPVLVVRTGTLSRILFATDGSASAQHAEDILAEWSLLRELPVDVLSVTDSPDLWIDALSSKSVRDAYFEAVATLRRRHEETAQHAAQRLAGSDRSVQTEVVAGDAADRIINEAASRGDDLIVLGTHGRTGLERLVLGSVARNVLLHAGCSVLIAREPRRRSTESAEGAALRPTPVA